MLPAAGFMQLFRGLERAHGTYDVSEVKPTGQKQTGRAVTLQSPVTEALWADHLSGTTRLGVVPIRDDGTCLFGAFDVDDYSGLDLSLAARKAHEMRLPLVICRTKSGGIHAYMFCSEPIPAQLVRERLAEFAALMGHGGCEVFPKQSKVLGDRGDIGNWINMPYFGGDETPCYGHNQYGQKLDMTDFLAYATSIRISKKGLESFSLQEDEDFKGGPPCLQILARLKLGEGIRNDGLFNVGVYLRKSRPETWEVDLLDYNKKYCDPPLPSSEVAKMIDSAKKKEYVYSCSRPPIKGHCNSSVCKTREHGIGRASGLPGMTGLTKYDAQPPIWFVSVEGGGRIELSTEDLQNQTNFQRRCMDVLNTMPPRVDNSDWQYVVQGLLENVVVIEAPVDATPAGRFWDYVEKFCTSRTQAKAKDELTLGKPWTSEGQHYFRFNDLLSYLTRQNFRELLPNRMASILKDKGGKHQFFNIKGRGINCWAIPQFTEQSGPIDVPDLGAKESF